jgi:hypothetical protein
MNYEIKHQGSTRHRETTFSEYVNIKSGHLRFDGIEVFVVKFDCDQKWWIIPCTYTDDDAMGDTGPYDEVEDALMMLKLLGEK